MHRVRLLQHHGITPYIVFDGGPLPAKKGTENHRAKFALCPLSTMNQSDSRHRSRAENLAKALALESQGRLKDARDCYTKCVDITPEMAYQLIKVSFPSHVLFETT
jgi:exonuclease-1